MIKVNLEDIQYMAEMGDKYREHEIEIKEIVEDAEIFLQRGTKIRDVEFRCSDKQTWYGDNGVNKKLNSCLLPPPEELYQSVLRNMNLKIKELLEEKKKLEEYGVVIRDEYFTFACKKDSSTVFDKANELKVFAELVPQEQEDDK